MSTVVLVPPAVAPVSERSLRPRWSVMIPTYECAELAQQAIESVLPQALPPEEMEIVVVDDASHDQIEEVVARYGGRVRLFKQQVNLGVPANLTESIRLSRGTFIHLLHGDDKVRPGFYAAMEQGFSDPDIAAVWCRQIFMDRDGNWIGISPLEAPEGRIPDPARFLAKRQRIMTPSICVRRSAYERLGGFHPALRCVEDWEMWVRIASRFDVGHLREPLAMYRMHDQSNTGRHLQNAEETIFAGRAIDLFTKHLSASDTYSVAQCARRSVARHALDTGWQLARRGDRKGARKQILAALRLCRDPSIVLRGAYNLLHTLHPLTFVRPSA